MESRSISAREALRVAAIVLAFIITLRFLWIAHAIFIITFLGVLAGLGLAKPVDFLERHRIKRGVAAPLVLVIILGMAIGIGAAIAPAVRGQTGQIASELPKAFDALEKKVGSSPGTRALLSQTVQKELRNSTKFLFPLVSSLFGAISGLVIVLFIAMYVAAEPGLYRAGILHLVPHRNRERAEEVLTALATTLRQWLVARLLAMVIVGVIVGVALALLRVKGAVALGVLAGLLELIPFFGPIVSAIPAIGVAMIDSPQKALAVIALFLIVQQIEGNVITPLILEKRLAIPPVLTVVIVSAMAIVFGVLGMLIAEPLLAAGLVLTKMLYVDDVVGDDVKVGKKNES